jgi:hypothetical protein
MRWPTYRLVPDGDTPRPAPRTLACEWCGQALAEVYSAAADARITGAMACAIWPEVTGRIRRHFKDCAGVPKKSRRQKRATSAVQRGVDVPTYRSKLKTAHAAGAGHELVCECCGQGIGPVSKSAPINGLTAADAALLWPELAKAIARHEDDCGRTMSP